MMKNWLIVVVLVSLIANIGYGFDWTGAVSIYEPNENGVLIDLAPAQYVGTLAMTGTVSTYDQAKVSPKSKGGYSTSNYFSNTSTSLWTGTESFSVSIWINYNATATTEDFFGLADVGSSHIVKVWRVESTSLIEFYMHGVGDPEAKIYPTVNVGDWFMLTIVVDGTNNTIYFNNDTTYASIATTSHNQFVKAFVGVDYSVAFSATHYNTNQIVFWNKSLSLSEIADLYNGGAGQYYSTPPPVAGVNSVALDYPNNLATNTTNAIEFGYTPHFEVGTIQNCSLWTNESGWGISQTINNSGEVCYQETATTATACGGLASGKYSSGNSSLYDGNWGTGARESFMVNYTIPANVNIPTSLIQYNFNGVEANVSMGSISPYVCSNNNSVLQLWVYDAGTPNAMALRCMANDGNWRDLVNGGAVNPIFYEEGIWWNYSIANNSVNTITHNFSDDGDWLWNIACWNETAEVFNDSNRTLTLTEYSLGYPATGYELWTYPFNVSFTFGGYTYANIGLVYNNTYYAGSSVDVTTPFLSANNTAISFYWNYTRDGVLKSTAVQTHNVYYSYAPDGSNWSASTYYEGDSASVVLFGWNNSPLGTVSAKLFDGTSNHSASVTGYASSVTNYTVSLTIPPIAVASLGKNYTWYLTVSYGGQTRTMAMTTKNITITQIGLIDCGGGEPLTLAYTTYDEQTWAYAIGSNYYAKIDIFSGAVKHSYSKVVLNAPDIEWCISPAGASFYANVSLLYGNTTDYVQRGWYWNNMLLSNVSQNISIFSLNTSQAFLTNINVKSQFGIEQPNIIVLFQKYNYTEGRYFNMTSVVSDGAGNAFVYLEEFNTPYKILLYDGAGNLLNTYLNYFIKETPITLRTTMQYLSLFYYFNQMSANCSWDNSTKYLVCDWRDGSGKLTKIDFYVREDMIFQTTKVCNASQTGSSGQFSCYLGSLSGVRSDYYSITAYIGDVGQLIMNGYVNTNLGLSSGKIASLDRTGGVILALLIVMFMFFVGIWKPALGVALGFAGFVLSIFLGLLDFGGAEFSVVGILLALTIFMIWRMKV